MGISKRFASEEYVTESVTAVEERVTTLETETSELQDTVNDHKDNTNIHVTAEEKQAWNNKSNFSGSYKDLTDKPQIPEGADLTGYAKESFVKEYAQPKGEYLETSDLSNAVNTALAQAKESGEFKGDKGDKGDSATDEQITNAVETYLTENPVSNSKKYAMRLLREVTIEESVTGVMISEDDDGNEIDAEILIISINPFNTNQNSSTGTGNLSIRTDSFEDLRVNTIGEIYRTTTSETPENSWAFYCAIVKLTKGCVEYVTGTAERLDNTFAMNTVNKSFKKGVVYSESYAPSTKLKGIGVANHWNAQVLGVGTQIRVYGGKEV